MLTPRTNPWSFHVADAALPPAGVVLLEGADRALRERYSVYAQQGRSRQSGRTRRAAETVADRQVSGTRRRRARADGAGVERHHRISRPPLSRTDAVHSRRCRARAADPVARPLLRSLRASADAKSHGRP